MESDWANLPQDLLVDIAMKLECVEHLVRFSAVCSSWGAVYTKVKSIWTPSMPWFILPEFHRNNNGHIRTVFDPNLNKSYEMDLPELFPCRCWGCRDGWIFTLSLGMEIYLFNPLTKTQLTLPSAHSIGYKNVDNFDCMEQAHFLREYIQKVVLLNIPPNKELVVLLVCNSSKWILYAKPGDSRWCRITGPDNLVKDVISIGNYFLILYEDWSLAVVGTDLFLDPTEYKANAFFTQSVDEFDDSDIYLVESSGDILMLCPYYADCITPYGITEIEFAYVVFIYDVDTRRWFETSKLGDVALFVGSDSAMSICASKAANCKQNCVYFVADEPEDVMNMCKSETVNPLGKYIGIFEMDSLCNRVFYDKGYSACSQYCPPFWFMPKLV